VGWKAIDLSVDSAGATTVHFQQLTLSGAAAEITGSFDVLFAGGTVTVVSIHFDDPGLASAALEYIELGPGCFGFDVTNCALRPLLHLVSPELDDGAPAASNILHLRIHTSAKQVNEVRLDWGAPTATRSLSLPGFSAALPAVQMISLLARRGVEAVDSGGQSRLTLVVTLANNVTVTLLSNFCWPTDDGKRQILRDGQGNNSDALVQVSVKTNEPLSLVLCDLPLSGGDPPRYLRQLSAPLASLADQEAGAGAIDASGTGFIIGFADPCPDTTFDVIPLKGTSVTVSVVLGSDFTFPFLNQGTDQLLTIDKSSSHFKVDPVTLAISCDLAIKITIFSVTLNARVALEFDLQGMTFKVNQDQGLWLSMAEQPLVILDLKWTFTPSSAIQVIPGSVTDDNLGGVRVPSVGFVLVVKRGNYSLRLAPGAVITIEYSRATLPDEPIVFRATEFALTPKGIDLVALVTDTPARFNGLETQFTFSSGALQIHESRLAGFTIAGTGALPKALVGPAMADVALQFAQLDGVAHSGPVRLVRGSAKISGSNLLHCQSTRFEFSLDGLGLEFVDDNGADHLYFTLTGRARYAPLPSDSSDGPLAWLPKIEIQLVDCPLTGNMRVIARHVKFLIELPKPIKFDLLGCFGMEIRAIGFVPQFEKLTVGAGSKDPTSAMQISGQIFFAEGGGDVIETKVDFHDLFVALPAKNGGGLPRLYCKGLGLTIKQGDSFELSGEVDFFENEPVDTNVNGKPIFGDGFAGNGMLLIQGLPRITATFAFLRVSPDGKTSWKRAWFLYLEAQEMSIQVPVPEMFIREIGLGFGYRYTLAGIRTADQINDPRKLLKELKRLASTQCNLSDRHSWAVDLEGPGEGARWTVALRAMMSQASSQEGPFGDYEGADLTDPSQQQQKQEAKEAEQEIPSLFLLDVVVALRSDLTFFMAGRAWINTNYADFHDQGGKAGLPDHPLFDGFVLLSPRQKRMLANLSSKPDAILGNHPPLPPFLTTAINGATVSATLLVEPGLFHFELGWPNQLQWDGSLGPLGVQFRGGAIFRVSTTEQVIGMSFSAQGSLHIEAGFDAGFIGASLSATAQVAFGARYIGVIAFREPLTNSAFYAAIGVEIKVDVEIDFYIQVKIFRRKIRKNFDVSLSVVFTAAVELGILPPQSANPTQDLPGMRGTGTIGVRLMGHDVHFDIQVEFNGDTLDTAIGITTPFLQVGLEAEDVQAIPGTSGGPSPLFAPAHAHSIGPAHAAAAAAALGLAPLAPGAGGGAVGGGAPGAGGGPGGGGPALSPRQAAMAGGIEAPEGYTLAVVNAPNFQSSTAPGQSRVYYLLVPKAPDPGKPTRFFPVPPNLPTLSAGIVHDFAWTIPNPPGSTIVVEQFDTSANPASGTFSTVTTGAAYQWKIDWSYGDFAVDATSAGAPVPSATLAEFLGYAYVHQIVTVGGKFVPGPHPVADPQPIEPGEPVADDRVQNPTEAAFEAAVRGATEQVTAPFFKFDVGSPYDSRLKLACAKNTTIYHPGGTTDGLSPLELAELNDSKAAIQLRGKILHDMLRDVQTYATLDSGGADDAGGLMADLRANSLAFRLGVVFRATGDAEAVHWLESGAGTIKQRTKPNSSDVDSTAPIPVTQFNTRDTGFLARPPAFLKVRKFEHADMVAFAWDLRRDATDQADETEDHLSHYQVRRLLLDGHDPEFQFRIKKGAVLHRETDNGSGGGTSTSKRLEPRFQMVDRFEDEVPAGAGVLTDAGKTYLYTVTPVDLAGNASPRPLSIVARRLPAEPPLVPGDGELVLSYQLSDDPKDWVNVSTGAPSVRPPDAITFQWSDPVPAPGSDPPPVERYRLVFRREAALPVGYFGSDSETRGGRTAGFPVTNAHTLRTDRVIEVVRNNTDRNRRDVLDPETGNVLRADSGRAVQQVTLFLNELEDCGIFPIQSDRKWRPDAWRVFVQAVTPRRGSSGETDGVPSALAAVAVRLRFERAAPAPPVAKPSAAAAKPAALSASECDFVIGPFEERKVGVLEWLPDPIRFNVLPPEDQACRDGFLLVPMPVLDPAHTNDWVLPTSAGAPPVATDDSIHGLAFEPHPERFRAIEMTWNQGPSADPNHPIELHARYQLFQFDADAQTGESLEFADNAPREFGEWTRSAGMRQVQDVELLPAEDLPLSPADTSNPVAWEVWTAANSRRILLRSAMIENGTWPAATDKTKLGPWYSWRDSYLVWPPDALRDTPGQDKAPPRYDKTMNRLWPFHDVLRAILNNLAPSSNPDTHIGATLPPPRYAIEVSHGTARTNTTELNKRADGTAINRFPNPNDPAAPVPDGAPPKEDATALAAFLAASSPASDPHGWGVLDRMGLSVAFRLRDRKTGLYAVGKDLAIQVGQALADLKAQRPAEIAQFLKHLNVEFLFQSGARTAIGPEISPTRPDVAPAGLLALVRLSLRPAVQQRQRYEAVTISGVPASTPFLLTITPNTTEGSYLVQTGTPGLANDLIASPTKLTPIMPKEGRLVLLLRGKLAGSTPIATVVATTIDGSTPLAVSVPDPFGPIDWRAAYFDIPQNFPWAGNAAADEQTQWDRLGKNLAKLSTGLALPDLTKPAERNDATALLSWLDRFFADGGDVPTPAAATDMAKTPDGPWIGSGYLRAATPIALTPDAAGRITYYQPIEDLWGHTYRYYLRPRGRYDLLWESLSFSRRIFCHAIGSIAGGQALMDAPDPGGLDVVLDRIRPLAAPLVLSSRRLDVPSAPGRTVPPGAIWEVLVAKHSEQTLIERNRALVNHLGFRQVAHTLVRSFAYPDAVAQLRVKLQSVVSSAFASKTSPLQQTNYELVVAGNTQAISGATSLQDLGDKINALAPSNATALVEATSAAGTPEFRLTITPKNAGDSIQLLAVVGSTKTNVVSEPLVLLPERFQLPVNSRETTDPKQLSPPALPGTPAALAHLDLGNHPSPDDGLSLDLPLRSADFSQGTVALQWRSLPYYYTYKLMLIAQSSAVVSAITAVTQRDFRYVSPTPAATMEGIPSGDGTTRRRKIAITLARYWDCLALDAQKAWAIEDPASVPDGVAGSSPTYLRRLSSVPDPDVIYQVLLTRPSQNLEVLAEYRRDPSGPGHAGDSSGYVPTPIDGPFKGAAIRALPPPDGPTVGKQFVRLETLLTGTSSGAAPIATVVEPISNKASFPGATAAVPGVDFPAASISACVLRIDKSISLSAAMITDLRNIAAASDPSFATAVRQLLAPATGDRYAEASIGLEQLAELHDGVSINATAKTVTWQGPISQAEHDVLVGGARPAHKEWLLSTLFQGTLNSLVEAIGAFTVVKTFVADAANPTAIAGVPPAKLTVASTSLTWSGLLTGQTPSPAEIAALLGAKAGAKADFVTAVDDLVDAIQHPERAAVTVPIVEPFWRPRPSQASLPASLQGVLLLANGAISFSGLMTLREGQALLGIAGLGEPDKLAVKRLFQDSLNSGLGGGTLEISARRGAAAPVTAPIQGSL
jgi:hypothetical protein